MPKIKRICQIWTGRKSLRINCEKGVFGRIKANQANQQQKKYSWEYKRLLALIDNGG